MAKQKGQWDFSEDHGIIVDSLETVFRWLQYFPPQVFINKQTSTKISEEFSKLSKEEQGRRTRARARVIDLYICGWLLIEIWCIIAQALGANPRELVFLIVGSLRLIDIVQVNANMLIFDALRAEKLYISSPTRSLINVIINFFELIFCFGLLYNYSPQHLLHSNDWTDGFYFSAITQLTVGYGDLIPLKSLKVLATAQTILGYLFTVLTISRFINILPRTVEVVDTEKKNEETWDKVKDLS